MTGPRPRDSLGGLSGRALLANIGISSRLSLLRVGCEEAETPESTLAVRFREVGSEGAA